MVACSTGACTRCRYELMQQEEAADGRVPGIPEPVLVLGGGVICIGYSILGQ